MEFNVDDLEGTLVYDLCRVVVKAMIPMGDENTLDFGQISLNFISLLTLPQHARNLDLTHCMIIPSS